MLRWEDHEWGRRDAGLHPSAAEPFGEPYCLLHRALLVRADREPGCLSVDGPLVGGQRERLLELQHHAVPLQPIAHGARGLRLADRRERLAQHALEIGQLDDPPAGVAHRLSSLVRESFVAGLHTAFRLDTALALCALLVAVLFVGGSVRDHGQTKPSPEPEHSS